MAEFVEKMYEKNSTGDWYEFANVAVELKWVNKTVKDIRDISFTTAPPEMDEENNVVELSTIGEKKIDPQGQAYVELPRLDSLDVYHLYNPGNYYR